MKKEKSWSSREKVSPESWASPYQATCWFTSQIRDILYRTFPMELWLLYLPWNTFNIRTCHKGTWESWTLHKDRYFFFPPFFFRHSKYITYISYRLKALEVKKLPAVFHSGNELHNRDKNRYRDILPCKLTMVLIIFLFTLDKR